MVATQRALASYRDLDPTFASTREHQLLNDLAEAVEQGDQEVFADKLFQFDQMSKLDKWKVCFHIPNRVAKWSGQMLIDDGGVDNDIATGERGN